MKTAVIYTNATFSDTIPAPGDPTYQTEVLALMLRKTLENMESAGMVFTAPEAGDFTTFNNEATGFMSDANARMDEILTTGVSSIVANVPDVLSIMAAISSGGGSEVLSILLRAVLAQMWHDRDSSITAAQGEPQYSDLSVDLSTLEQELAAIRAELEAMKRGLILPANGVAEIPLVDGMIERLTNIEQAVFQVLSTFNINLLSDEYEAYFSATQDTGEDDN